ncbi:MAG: hypothetical protein AAGA18_04970 [Verrucomicrobiota bacterium]
MPTSIKTVIKLCGTPSLQVIGNDLRDAIREKRVLTIFARVCTSASNTRTRKTSNSYFGKPGYHPDKSEYTLIFPKPLPDKETWNEISQIQRSYANHDKYLLELKNAASQDPKSPQIISKPIATNTATNRSSVSPTCEYTEKLQKKLKCLDKQILSSKAVIKIGDKELIKNIFFEISTKKKPQLKLAKKATLSQQELKFLAQFT